MSEIIKALVKCQQDKRWGNPTRNREVTVKTTSGGAYKFAYATLDGILDQVRPILAENNLVLSWHGYNADGREYLTARLNHISGETLETTVPVIAERNGAQGFGSGLSYAQRYGALSILGLCGADDDDGNMADGNDTPAAADRQPRPLRKAERPPAPAANVEPLALDEIMAMSRLIAKTSTDEKKLCRAYKVAMINNLTRAQWAEAMKVLKAKSPIKSDEEANLEAEQRDIFKEDTNGAE